ncbi:hypothetical protein MIZ03_1439 [Rhodoferax lithotrophicus]|uniref:Uncharacterized protein n=1 Tax=Rhodoferax lithotrophicus TaxID=2798804 RepID=A0ABN6D6T1_9BURK|nr:hypothetical protein MIZ03_1439 [Rhodoferax sp. MIZ03]
MGADDAGLVAIFMQAMYSKEICVRGVFWDLSCQIHSQVLRDALS